MVHQTLHEGQSFVTHLLSGGGGAPGAVLAAASSVWTSVKVRASPSAKSTYRISASVIPFKAEDVIAVSHTSELELGRVLLWNLGGREQRYQLS